jgi:hypothetical protein
MLLCFVVLSSFEEHEAKQVVPQMVRTAIISQIFSLSRIISKYYYLCLQRYNFCRQKENKGQKYHKTVGPILCIFVLKCFHFRFFSYLCIRFEDFAINSARNSSSDLSLIKEVCSALWQT